MADNDRNFYTDLVRLITGQNGQVDTFIKNVMREEDIENGNPPKGKNSGTYRFGRLQNLGPTESYNNETLGGRNNNPEYPANIVDRMNTPFDHVERILLQDFSDLMFNDDTNYNYFKSIYDDPNGVFGEYRDASKYHLDSFTYTPFIDYSQT